MSAPRRTSLTQFGGELVARGDPQLVAPLQAAWRATSGPDRELTHGFHAYPARSHPQLVRTLIAAFSRAGERVVDPFCGSGTTLVEALAAGRRALGADVNGVAVRIAQLKTWRPGATERSALLAAAGRIARQGAAAARQRDGRGSIDAPLDLRSWFSPHVWRELDALGNAIDEVRSPQRHGALLLVLSSLLTKVSRRRAETDAAQDDKQIAPGFTSRLYADRAQELGDGLAALERATLRATPAPLVVLADARALPVATGAAQLVVTSPPYLGTYDYSQIQELRAKLLSIPIAAAGRHEIGARSAADPAPATAIAAFRRDLAASLREIGRVLAPGGTAVIVIGDSVAGDRRVRADELVAEAAKGGRLAVAAACAQERGGTSPRREHLIALRER